jgi:predicted permease
MKWWPTRNRNADLERELRSDLSLEEEEQRERGASPDEARYAALRAFGNPTLIREQTHETWGWTPVERLAQDLRYALRQLRRAPGFTVTCVLILALGIGAVTAVFSLIDAALLRMLPVDHPEQLVEFKNVNPAFPVNDAFAYPTAQALGAQTETLAGVFAFRYLHNVDVAIDGRSQLAESQLVSGDYFSVLGVRPILGRTILPTDASVAGQAPVAVLSYDYWRAHFAADPAIVGKHVLLNNAPFTIVGVTTPEFYGVEPGHKVDISVPLTMVAAMNPAFAAAGSRADALTSPSRNWLHVMGRLQPGVSREKALASLQPVFAQCMHNAADSLTGLPFDSPAVRQAYLHFRLEIDPGSQGLASLRRQFSKPLWIVMAVVGLLLLITCANVANLLLARARAREREIAVRLALGSGRLRIVRQLLIESLLLGIAGGLAGVGLAFWGSRSLLALMAQGRNPVSLSVHPDLGLLSFALALSLITALVFGIVPALRATDVDPSRSIAHNARSAGVAHHRLGKSLVILQVAISLVLVVGAGLLARTVTNLRSFYPGFNRENVLLFSVNPSIVGYQDVVPLYHQLLERIQAAPGVRVASLSVHEPLSANASTTTVRVLGPSVQPGEDLATVDIEPIAPDYFRTLQIPILRGREFSADDRDGAPKVAIVNESFARHYFGDTDAIGRSVSIPGYRGDSSWLRIVGEVRDVKVHDLREPPTLMLYQPMFQAPEGGANFEIRTAIDPAAAENAVLDAIRAVDSRLPVYEVRTLGGQLDDSLVQERLVASLSELFGLLALLLTSVGLYGLMSYSVHRRTGEIGIRMALGAGRPRIARLILRETLLLVAGGLILGLPGAILASRLIASQLFGLRPSDPVTFLAACAVMALVAVIASWLPARRAASVQPMQALRAE